MRYILLTASTLTPEAQEGGGSCSHGPLEVTFTNSPCLASLVSSALSQSPSRGSERPLFPRNCNSPEHSESLAIQYPLVLSAGPWASEGLLKSWSGQEAATRGFTKSSPHLKKGPRSFFEIKFYSLIFALLSLSFPFLCLLEVFNFLKNLSDEK